VSRLVVVSNRVASLKAKANVGGMAIALHAALQQTGGVWFGWSGSVVDGPPGPPQITHADRVTYGTISLSTEDYNDYYNGFANRTLWPLFHYRTDLTTYDRRFYDGELRVNARFAENLVPLIEPDDMIWVHDYHLIPLGEELRRRGLRQAIGFFLHIPFPATEVLLTLPTHRELVRAMFAYDLVGFQTESDLRSFADYVVFEAGGTVTSSGALNAFGRTVRAEVFPIGIDTDDFIRMSRSPEAQRQRQRMARSLHDRSLIIGVDRLDYSKGLRERLEAYERLLKDFPENRGRVTLVQIAPRSRTDVPEYVDVRRELQASCGRINGRFGDFDWVPIRYLNRVFTRRSLAGLFQASQVGLVTPFRDGMNLVAKEYVAAQTEEDPGVLVLSRFAGAARQLEAAVIVNPYDTEQVAEALQQALHMPLEERRERWAAMMVGIHRDDVFAWRDKFVKALSETRRPIEMVR